jgi:uncharacterized protein YktB (UPF0637 family)
MKFLFTKIVSVFLASIVLFSTMSFRVNIHHCYKNKYSISEFNDVEKCEMKAKLIAAKKYSIEENGDCCITDTFFKKGDNELMKTSNKINFEALVFLYSYINVFERLEKNTIPFLNYDPPLIFNDIIVLHETFLI